MADLYTKLYWAIDQGIIAPEDAPAVATQIYDYALSLESGPDFGDFVGVNVVPQLFGFAAPVVRAIIQESVKPEAPPLPPTELIDAAIAAQTPLAAQTESRTDMALPFYDEEAGFDFPSIFNQGLQLYTAYQQQRASPLMRDTGEVVEEGGGGGGGMVQTSGALGGAIAAGGIWLGSLLARTFGRSLGGLVFTAANGVRVRYNQLWPLVRRYGPQVVAGGLGIGVGALGELLMHPSAARAPRKRGRGISARDLKTSKRTIRQIRRFSSMLGLNRGRSSRGYPRRSSRRGHYGWH